MYLEGSWGWIVTRFFFFLAKYLTQPLASFELCLHSGGKLLNKKIEDVIYFLFFGGRQFERITNNQDSKAWPQDMSHPFEFRNMANG